MYDEIKDGLFQLIETEMSDGEEQLFMKSYKLFLQYGSNSKEFVINFDIVWNWVGFTKIGNAKTLLIKNFIEHKDYIKLAFFSAEASLSSLNQHGGHNKETILLTVDCFKNFCMKAGTTRANEVRQYYIKMENILHKYIQSKFLELRDKDIPLFKKVEPNNFVLFAVAKFKYLFLGLLSMNSIEEYKMFENIIYKIIFSSKK
jgi:phage anti-repressor protein